MIPERPLNSFEKIDCQILWIMKVVRILLSKSINLRSINMLYYDKYFCCTMINISSW